MANKKVLLGNMTPIAKESLDLHFELKGKIETKVKYNIKDRHDLSLMYTPGVAQPCIEINKDYNKSWDLTARNNTIAVITDGTAVLGLGDIGPEAGMPVMEGKCALFKTFGGVDAVPICIRSKNVDELVRTIYLISGSFGGINLEDIGAPRCVEVERRLKEICDIPVFHDDQHGTAIVVAAAVTNALRVAGKSWDHCTTVINGAGSAGMAIGNLLHDMGMHNIIYVDRAGIVDPSDRQFNQYQVAAAIKGRNTKGVKGQLPDALKGADIFIGVSVPGALKPEWIKLMNEKPIIFAMANPTPEIMPDIAKQAGAYIVGTGRSDFPNQINNLQAFPGIFKGALSVRAKQITEEMKHAAARAIASMVKNPTVDNIMPSALDKNVAEAVANEVARCWVDEERRRAKARAAERIANQNIVASSKAETKAVTAEQRISSSEAVIANRADIKMFRTHKRAEKKPVTKKKAKKAKK